MIAQSERKIWGKKTGKSEKNEKKKWPKIRHKADMLQDLHLLCSSRWLIINIPTSLMEGIFSETSPPLWKFQLKVLHHKDFAVLGQFCAKIITQSEVPLILESRGPGTSSSMKLGVLFAFQGSPDYYWSFFIFFQSFFVYLLKDCPISFVLMITFLADWLSSPCYDKFT